MDPFHLIEHPQFVCPMCGSDDFKPEKLAVCLRDFDGAICQRCGTIVTQAEAEYCRQMEKIIDAVIERESFPL
jgi:RNA polymerase subunit RPABC4/transcription elongation factor Spt4